MNDISAIQNVVAKTAVELSQPVSSKTKPHNLSGPEKSFSKLLSSMKQTDAEGDTSRIDSTAKTMQKFEAMVVSEMFGTMLKSMPGDSFGAGMSGDFYKSMFAEALGEQIAKHGGLGIARLAQHTDANRLAK